MNHAMNEAYVWLEAWLAIVSSGRAGRSQLANAWADACVDAYRTRYGTSRGTTPKTSAKTGKQRQR